ncbi:MAG: PKD domain-containing protein [Euryarchaeota archaeon]|nr:PKD domain-containing protein [Euryarchaeota archaeon]
MSASRRNAPNAQLLLLTVLMPLALLATVLLPGGGVGSGPLGTTPPPTSGTAPPQTPHPGAAPHTMDGSYATMSVDPSTSALVMGGTEELTAQISPGEGVGEVGIFSVSWSLPSNAPGYLGTSDTTTAPFYASPVVTPTTTVVSVQATGYVVPIILGEWFTVDATAAVTVVPPLSASALLPNPDPAAPGESISLTSEVSGGLPPFTLSFVFGDGSSATLDQSNDGKATISHSYAAGTFSPTAQVADGLGDHAVTSALSSVVVTAHLGAAILPPSGADRGTATTFRASVGGGSAPYSFLWSDSWGDSSYSSGAWTLAPSRVGPLTVQLSVSDADGQVTVAPSVTVQVAAPPSVALSSAVPEADAGTPFPLLVDVEGGTAPFELVWDPGEGVGSLATELPADGTFAEPYTFSVPGSLSANAEVIDALGISFSTEAQVGTVVAPPNVGLSASPAVPTQGLPFELTATVTGGIAPYSWDWVFDGPVSSSSPFSGTMGTAGSLVWNGSLSVSEGLEAELEVQDASGGQASSALDLQVLAPLTASLSVQPLRGEVGQPLSVLATFTGGEGPYTLTLSASDGEAATSTPENAGTALFSLIPRTPGNLTVSLRATDTLGHVFVSSTIVSIAPEFQGLLSVSSGSVDAGGQISATVLLQGGWAPFSGVVSTSDGRVFPFQGPSPSFTLTLGFPTRGYVTLTAMTTDALGSPSTRTVEVSVNPAPWATLACGGGQTDVGAPLAFLARAGGGTGVFPSVTVSYGDGGSTTSWSSSHLYGSVGTFLANATVTDSVGGKASSAPELISVVPDPQAAAEMTQAGADQGLATSFASQVSFGTPPYSYLWNFGDGGVSALSDPSHDFAQPGAYHVALTVTDSTGRSSSAPVVNVSVAAPPALSASANRSELEVGASGLFQATVLGGASPAQVVWTFGDGSVATGRVLNHTYTSPGSYDVQATLTDAAGGTATEDLALVVAPALAATGTSISPTTGEVGVRSLLTEVPTGGVAPFYFQWQAGGFQGGGQGLSSWAVFPNASGPLSGTVTVVDADGARSTAAFTVEVAAALSLNLTSVPTPPEATRPFQLLAGVAGGVAPFTYSWSVPFPLSDPGNRSAWDAVVPTAGAIPLSLTVADADGRMLTSTTTLNIAPQLSVSVDSVGVVADAGVPVVVRASVLGGIGPVHATFVTPFGTFPLGSSVVFPTPGVFPVQVVATDSIGAVAVAETNLSVAPPPVASFLRALPRVAVGAMESWQVSVLGGSAPYTITWSVPGVGTSEGTVANFTLPSSGTYQVVAVVHDAAGAVLALRSNATALPDDLALAVNATRTEGLAPLRTDLVISAIGNATPVAVTVEVDGALTGTVHDLAVALPWVLPLAVAQPGMHTVSVRATDPLGAQANATFTVGAFGALSAPSISPLPATVRAGCPLTLTASGSIMNGTWVSGEQVGWSWWGENLTQQSEGVATFLSDRAGAHTAEVSGTVTAPDGTLLENLTTPIPIEVHPAEAMALSVLPNAAPDLAGTNATVLLEANDAFGNLNTSYAGNVSAKELSGPGGSTELAEGTFAAGDLSLTLLSTKAGLARYALTTPLSGGGVLNIPWQANPSRAVLRLLSWERIGSSLLLNVSALDVYGNPLSNLTVEAKVPGGASVQGVVQGGNVSLLLPGAVGAADLELVGPDGAETMVVLPSGGDPPSGTVSLLLVAVFLGSTLATGTFIAWNRRRQRARRDKARRAQEPPTLSEAKGAMEEIIEHLPGEDRASLLMLAEEHGIPRKDAEEALILLEQNHQATRRVDSEGIERWDPPVPEDITTAETPADETSPKEGA